MDTSLSRRYRDARPVHSGAHARLESAHDVVADAEVWLLRASGLDAEDAALTLALRVEALGDIGLTCLDDARWKVEVVAGEVVVVMAPVTGTVFTTAWTAASAEERATLGAQLGEDLRALASRGVPLGPIDTGALQRTDSGVRLLPSAWMVPPNPPPGQTVTHWDVASSRSAVRSLIETLARRDGPAFAVSTPPLAEAVPAAVLEEVAELEEGRALVLQEASRPHAFARHVPSWVAGIRDEAVRRGLQVLELSGHHTAQPPQKEPGRPAMVLVTEAEEHAAVAVAIEDLSGTDWMDGHERIVWIRAGSAPDPVLSLYLEARFGDAVRTVEFSADARNAEELPSAGALRFLLDALTVAGTALPLALLQRWTWLPSDETARWVVEGWRRGLLCLATGPHVTSSGIQTTVAVDCPVDVDPDRARELCESVPEILDGVASRRLAAAWWRGRLLARAGAVDAATRQLRDVARRGEERGLIVFASSVYDLLQSLAGQASIDDELRGAALRSELLQKVGDLEGAQAVLDGALVHVREQPDTADPIAWADLVFRSVKLDLHRSDFAAAEDRLEDLLERSRAELPLETRSVAYGELAWAQLHRGRTRDAVRTCELALRRLDPLQHGALVARLHTQMGFALYRQSDYSQSLVHYDRALRLREQLGDDLGVARTQNNMALSFAALGQAGEAEATLLDSIRRKRAAGEELSMAASLLNLAVVRVDVEDFEGAEDVANQALEIARRRRHPETEAEVFGVLGDVALARHEPAAARELFEKNLKICEANGHDTERLLTLRRLGAALLALGEDDAAAERIEEARQLLDVQPSRFEAAQIDALEAEILVRAGALPAAAEIFGQAARGFARVGRPREQVEALVRRGEIEHELGRDARVRATWSEVREVVERHEIHRPPKGLDRLERFARAQPAGGEPLTAEACLGTLMRAIDQEFDGLSDAGRAAFELGSTLGADAVIWIDGAGESSIARAQGWDAVSLPSTLGEAELEPDATMRVADFDLFTTSAGRDRIAIQRKEGLRAPERDLVRASLHLWSRGRVLAAEASRIAPASRSERAVGDVRRFGLIGRSEGMRRVIQWIERVADTDLAVLVLGPNGSGKELVARGLHRASGRADGPFVAINCASIPASLLESELFGHERGAFTSAHAQRIGRFEQARGGTLFLDEIGEMPADMQAKLLRVLQERSFMRVGGSELLTSDARIVAATNRDLEAEVERGSFRVDLYYRLNVVTIEVPPLRDRVDDIEPLVRHFVARDGLEYRGQSVEVDPEVFEHLRDHEWPGNVRELENAVRNALVFGRDALLRPEDFPRSSDASPGKSEDRLDSAVRAIVEDERWAPERPILPRLELLIAHALVERVGNKTLAARLLGITKPTLYDRLRRYEALFGDATGAAGR